MPSPETQPLIKATVHAAFIASFYVISLLCKGSVGVLDGIRWEITLQLLRTHQRLQFNVLNLSRYTEYEGAYVFYSSSKASQDI